MAEECNHGEGKITVSSMEGNKGIKVLVTGKNPGFREGAELALKGTTTPDNLDPRSVHAYITGRFAAYFDFDLNWQAQPDFGRVEFQLSFRP
jgi:hypothetical protein